MYNKKFHLDKYRMGKYIIYISLYLNNIDLYSWSKNLLYFYRSDTKINMANIEP